MELQDPKQRMQVEGEKAESVDLEDEEGWKKWERKGWPVVRGLHA